MAVNMFRDGSYHKYTLFGKRRVKEGECCAIWDSKGSVRNVVGPKLEWIYMSDVRFLDRFVADQNGYLVVAYRDGRKEHIRGPASIFMDPVVHHSIEKKAAISLNASEVIVVYTELDCFRDGVNAHESSSSEISSPENLNVKPSGGAAAEEEDVPLADAVLAKDGKRVSRRIIRGPTLFIPAANEWIHKFSWHGSNDLMGDERTMIKDALKLSKIRTLPDQLYYNVQACRTADDAQLCVNLMVFYQVVDLEKMLDSTHDPIGDFINALSADVIKFTAQGTFEQFVKCSSELNELSAFPLLLERARGIGYSIDKVVFRGYKASSQLQAMHDSGIKTRTQLQLEARSTEQKQAMEDLILERKIQRSAKEHEMEAAARAHSRELSALDHAERLQQAEAEATAAVARQVEADNQRLVFLRALKDQGVDLTKYLCALERGDEKVVRIEGCGSVPHLHLKNFDGK